MVKSKNICMYAYIHTYVVATLQRIKKPSKGEKLRGEDGDFSKCWAIFRDLTPNKHRLRVPDWLNVVGPVYLRISSYKTKQPL